MNESQLFQCDVGGRTLVIETGKLAGQAEGAATIRYGDTVVLVTVCTSSEPREGTDFLPLTIDYEERLYAAGKIPGGFIRREGRPSQEAILACRLTDRPLRPLLPKDWRRDIQVIVTVLSADQENSPDILSVIGGSAVLSVSEVPFAGPVSAVRVGYIEGDMVLNPTLTQLEESKLDLVVASTRDSVVMVEAGASEVSEDTMIEAIEFGHRANQPIIELQDRFHEACGKAKADMPTPTESPELKPTVARATGERLDTALAEPDKIKRNRALEDLKNEVCQALAEMFTEKEISSAFEAEMKSRIRSNILERSQRISGRALSEIRPLSCELGVLPRTHGSALFTRGQTQVLTISTLGSTRQEQRIDGLGIEETKRFMHHYNFTPFSVGEVKRLGSPGRREIGHGALAERALLPILPDSDEFPYTIRLVSEVLSSNGSTSMASVCASSLSLMDSGIPIKRAVAGIAMGVITGSEDEFAVLTDIEGAEDACGDMDFKVAGTVEGITALQLDIKIKKLNMEILRQALHQAREARLFILDVMGKTISTSRSELSQYAPRVYKLKVDTEKIGTVIGPKGKTIRAITEETKVSIDIEDDGTILIGSADSEAAQKAIDMINSLTREVEVGAIYTGKVMRLMNFGAFVEILPGKEGLVHISELADHRVACVEDVVKVGDEITVKVTEIDRMGRINLSRRAAFETSQRDEGSKTGGAKTAGRSSGKPEPNHRNRPGGNPRNSSGKRM